MATEVERNGLDSTCHYCAIRLSCSFKQLDHKIEILQFATFGATGVKDIVKNYHRVVKINSWVNAANVTSKYIT